MGVDVRITHKIPSLEVSLIERCLPAEVHVLGMKDFDVILGMDWLKAHCALLDCHYKKIIFQKSREKEFAFQCPTAKFGKCLISTLRVGMMIEKGCTTFLICVVIDNVVAKSIRDVDVVKEFEDVFLEDLSGLPLDREMEFSLDLLPRASPMSMAPYRMAPVELAELKK